MLIQLSRLESRTSDLIEGWFCASAAMLRLGGGGGTGARGSAFKACPSEVSGFAVVGRDQIDPDMLLTQTFDKGPAPITVVPVSPKPGKYAQKASGC